jgi:hypothetical protein
MHNWINFLIIFSGVAEELCRLFPTDDNIDMTPILRQSKEAARRQRAKPEEERGRAIPTSKPLAGMQFGPPRPGPDRSRKRRYPEEDYYSRPKMPRGGHGPMGRPSHMGGGGPPPVSRYATGGAMRATSSRSYEEYLRSMRPSPYSSSYPNYPPPRSGYESRSSYDGGYGYGHGRSPTSGPAPHDRRSYDRSVEDFLRRTSGGDRSHGDRYRRYDRR